MQGVAERQPEAFEAHLKQRKRLLFHITDLDARRPVISGTLLLDLWDWVASLILTPREIRSPQR